MAIGLSIKPQHFFLGDGTEVVGSSYLHPCKCISYTVSALAYNICWREANRIVMLVEYTDAAKPALTLIETLEQASAMICLIFVCRVIIHAADWNWASYSLPVHWQMPWLC